MNHCSVSWKITPLYFYSSNLLHFGKRAHSKDIFRLLRGWVKIHQIHHVIFEIRSQFFFKHYITPQRVSWEITLLYFFSWHFIWFGQKELIKVQNFRLLTAYMKFHQICTLIGSFCWKYVKFHQKEPIKLVHQWPFLFNFVYNLTRYQGFNWLKRQF